MMLGLIFGAIGLAATGQGTGSVSLPLDYYTADELANHLSGKGVKYFSDRRLNADVYLLDLPPAPLTDQIKLLSHGLHLRFETAGSRRSIGPDPDAVKAEDRLRLQILTNLADGFEYGVQLSTALLEGGPLPDWLKPTPAVPVRIHFDLKDPGLKPAFDVLAESAPPDAQALLDSCDSTAVYPRSALSSGLAAELDRIVPSPPLDGMIFGYQVQLFANGPGLTVRMVPMSKGVGRSPLSFFAVNPPVAMERHAVVDSFLKNIYSYLTPRSRGLDKKDLDLLAKREAATDPALADFASATAKVDQSIPPFSLILASLAKAAETGLIYKVNPHDDRPASANAKTFSELFGKGSGYTATREGGILLVKDELAILPSFDTVPEAAMIEMLHAMNPGKTIPASLPLSRPLFTQDLERYASRVTQIEGHLEWPRYVAYPPGLDDEGERNLIAAPLVVPVLRQLSDADFEKLGQGYAVNLTDVDIDPALFLQLLYKSPTGFSTVEQEMVATNAKSIAAGCSLDRGPDGPTLKVVYSIQTRGGDPGPRLNPTFSSPMSTIESGNGRLSFTCLFTFSPGDPILKRLPG